MAIRIVNRSLDIPISERNIGHTGDNLVEVRIFELNRYYSNIDMSVFDFKLDTQVGDVKNIIDLDKAISGDKIVLTWLIKESHLTAPGRMDIQIRAFKDSEEKWHSAQDYVNIQSSINASAAIPDPLPSEFAQMEQRITAMRNEVVEKAAIVEEAGTEVLPQLMQAIEDAGDTKNLLDGSIEEAGTIKTNLDGSIEAAGEAKTELEGNIIDAGTAKGQLEGTITSANDVKGALDGSITTAGQVKSALDEAIANGDLAAFKAEFESHKNDYATYKDSNNLKVAKVEKDLNDYQKTLSQVNVNQEAKQKVSGHGTISLPKNAANGQVNAVIQGNTRTNLVKNGNLELGTTEHWGSAIVIENGWFRSTGTTVSLNNQIVKVKPNTTYTLSVLSYSRGLETGVSAVYYRFKDQDGNVLTSAVPISEKNTAPQKYSKTVTTTETTTYIEIYSLSGSENWCYFKEIMIEEGDKLNPYISGTKSTVSAMRIRIVSEDEAEGSTAYVLAKDEDGNIEELRSLPNGTKDEVRVSENKLIKRIGDKTNVASGTVIDYSDMTTGGQFVAYASDGTSQVGVKGDTLTITATTLTYQLATPIEIPIQTSGSLVSYPSGTVYIEPFVADAGIYTDKMEVLYSDLPIKALEKISKVDFDTGLETELDITVAVIAEDKLSFTHPDLTSGDIVFFVYEHGAEGTIPETEISYYDSRYVIKGEDDKFYQWEIEAKLVEGVITPSIKLVEV